MFNVLVIDTNNVAIHQLQFSNLVKEKKDYVTFQFYYTFKGVEMYSEFS